MSRSKANHLSDGDVSHIEPSKLNFDLANPRFVDEQFSDETEVIRYLYEQMDVDELIQSILSAGYLDYEPIIVQRSDNVVLEGNRRLAALRLISDQALRDALEISLPAIPAPKTLPDRVRVSWVADRKEARDFIGFKHINGP